MHVEGSLRGAGARGSIGSFLHPARALPIESAPMLFDLRGRGRRRTVQVIYVGLALLFGVGFIGFGVGVGGGGGGILNALTGESGAPKASFAGQVKKYQKLAAEQPKSLSAWEGLINAQCTKPAANPRSATGN